MSFKEAKEFFEKSFSFICLSWNLEFNLFFFLCFLTKIALIFFLLKIIRKVMYCRLNASPEVEIKTENKLIN